MTYKRRAMLIMSPDEGEHYLSGVAIDEDNWTRHLLSANGGAWEEREIAVLRNPKATDVRRHLNSIGDADYVFIAFSGHGAALSDYETRLNVHPNEVMSSKDLKSGALKQTLVLDCCRLRLPSLTLEAAAVRKYAADSMPNRSRARRLFDEHLGKCANFHVVLNSCSVGETAGETESTGGLYSNALIRVAKVTASGIVKGVREAHLAAKILVTERQASQHPTAELPRSNPTFPFAIGD